MYQIQTWKLKLIAYPSKRLPDAARKYSITELEVCGLAINIASFSHLLNRVDFDTIVYHLALTHIIKSKAEPATTRIKRLLELISSNSFNLYCMKGKDMILSDFLSRQIHDDSNPPEIIPISFNMHNILHEKYCNIGKSEKYLIQTWFQTRSSGIKLLEFHGVSKNLDPNIQPEKQNIRHLKGNEISQERPRIGQGRVGMRKRRPPPINQINVSELSKKIPVVSKIENKVITYPSFTTPVQSVNSPSTEAVNRRSLIKNIPFHPHPTYRPPPKPIRIPSSEGQENIDISPEIIFISKQILHFKKE